MAEGPGELRLRVLVLRCQTGDERAFAQLFDAFSRRTLGYLKGLVDEDAEDLNQELWLAVYRSIRNLSNPGAFRTWLFQATRHRAIDWLRRRKRERALLDLAALELQAVGESGDDRRIAELAESELAAAIAQLPAAQREVLLLRYQNDLSYAEIALVVGSSLGTVKSRLFHARRRVLELTGGQL